jgi:hypothetical protein
MSAGWLMLLWMRGFLGLLLLGCMLAYNIQNYFI